MTGTDCWNDIPHLACWCIVSVGDITVEVVGVTTENLGTNRLGEKITELASSGD
jgi:hypothetical protein